MDNTKYQFWEVPTFYLYYQTQKRHCTCTYLSIYRILWKLKQTESYAFLRGSISYGLNQRRVILGAKRQEFLLTVFYFTRKNNKIKLVILYKQNQDFLYLFALDIILTKYSRWIGKACFFDWCFHPFLYDFYLTLQNPQAYCIIFLTRIAYPLTVLFLKNYKLSWLWANQLLWKFLFALCLPIFRSLGGA